jgi:hypothetical protein
MSDCSIRLTIYRIAPNLPKADNTDPVNISWLHRSYSIGHRLQAKWHAAQ